MDENLSKLKRDLRTPVLEVSRFKNQVHDQLLLETETFQVPVQHLSLHEDSRE